MFTHSSWLIDEVFIDKYCQSDEKKKLEEEKKKKEDEEKINSTKKNEKEEKKIQDPSKVIKVQETMNKNSLIEKGKHLKIDCSFKYLQIILTQLHIFEWIYVCIHFVIYLLQTSICYIISYLQDENALNTKI